MKKLYKFMNKLSAYLGLGLIAFGLILFIIREMSSDNPQNQPNQDPVSAHPQASNKQPLTTPTPAPVPFSAYFAIFTNGTFRIFEDPRYHNLDKTVFIESPTTPNTITITDPNITWGDFFATLPMELTKECLITGTGQEFCKSQTTELLFYINGMQNQDALDQIINQGDRLLVSYGTPNSTAIQAQLERLSDVK